MMALQPKAFIIDIDGVLITGNQRIERAETALQFLDSQNIPYVLITNTTRKSRVAIWNNLKRQGFRVNEDRILTAPLACVNWLRQKGVKQIYPLLSGSALNDFREFTINAASAEYVVMGDMGQDLNFEKLNTAFRLVMSGAKIIALQKNRYWKTPEGLNMDSGAMVAALEFSSKKKATIIGKPRKAFFMEAVNQLNLPVSDIAVIGDDLESDIDGAQKAGLKAIAVNTGKFPSYDLTREKIQPDYILDSIADLPALLKEKG